MDNADNPEVLAVVPLPTPQQRRRREGAFLRAITQAGRHQWWRNDPLKALPFSGMQLPPANWFAPLADGVGNKAVGASLNSDHGAIQ
jgi:hypothetical protein